MNSFNWFFDLACECIDVVDGDQHRGVKLMVDRLMTSGIPREVWEDECKAYIHTAAVCDELEDMTAEEIITEGLNAAKH